MRNFIKIFIKKFIKNPKYLVLSLLPIIIIITIQTIIFFSNFSNKKKPNQNQNNYQNNLIKKTKKDSAKKYVSSFVSEPIEPYQYILKEFNGKLGVFKKNQEQPEIIFDVIIDNLPDVDIAQLKEGLKIQNEQELNDRIEDFIS